MIRNFEYFLRVKDRLLYLGSIIETMIISSVKALVERREVLVSAVESQRAEAEKVRKELDEKCISLIATQQPAANGLRFLTSSMKIAGELGKQLSRLTTLRFLPLRSFPQARHSTLLISLNWHIPLKQCYVSALTLSLKKMKSLRSLFFPEENVPEK